MKLLLIVLVGCLTLPAQLLASCNAPLQFATFASVDGCHLTVYFHSNASIREAYLAPALCVAQDIRALIHGACPHYDPLLNANFINVQVTVANPSMLSKAEAALRPLLQDRTLAFLELLGIQEAESWQLPLMQWDHRSESEIVYLRLPCEYSDCSDRISQFQRRQFDTIEQTELLATLGLPRRSATITLTSRFNVANQSRILSFWKSITPGQELQGALAILAQRCLSLLRYKEFTVGENCTISVWKLSDIKGHYVIEPMLCYLGNHSADFNDKGGTVILKLQVKSDRVLRRVLHDLRSLSPKSVEFMSLVGVEVKVSNCLTEWRFGPLRLSSGDGSAELPVRCHSGASCRSLIESASARNTSLWRHLRFTLASQVNNQNRLCVWNSQKAAVSIQTMRTCSLGKMRYLAAFQPINRPICLRPEFTRKYQFISDGVCAAVCTRTENCQAFTTARRLCELFVFGKCSTNLIDSSCDEEGTVHVKKRAGVKDGALCPEGYGDDFRGAKYRLYANHGNWEAVRRKCESDGGLAMLVHLADAEERNHVISAIARAAGHYWTGSWTAGYQTPGSAEPASGWHWTGCSTPVNRSVWMHGEPNNVGGNEQAMAIAHASFGPYVMDNSESSTYSHVLCKCVSPF